MNDFIFTLFLIVICICFTLISIDKHSTKILYDDLHMMNTVSIIYCKDNKGIDYINIRGKTINVKCNNGAFFKKVEYRTK